MDTKERARRLSAAIKEGQQAALAARKLSRALLSGTRPDTEDMLEMKELFPPWTPGLSLRPGDLVRHAGKLYRTVLAHVSQANWSPERAANLFTTVQRQEGVEILQWVVGELVTVDDLRAYNGHTYRCRQAHTTQAGWSPDVVASLWTPVE